MIQDERFFRALLDISLQMARTRDLQPLLEYAMATALELVGAERGYLILVNPDGTLDFEIYLDKHGNPIPQPDTQVSHTIVQWVLDSHEPLVLMNAIEDSPFSVHSSVSMLGLRSVMCVPIRTQHRTIGAIYVENRAAAAVFRQDDLEPLLFFATQAGVFIENALLNENLEAEVRARTVELEAINADLEAFAHTVAHDLKNPLTWLIGFSEIIESEHASMPPADLELATRNIGQCGHKMVSIVDELLLLAHVRRMEEVPTRTLDMGAVVDAALSRLANLIAADKAQVSAPGPGAWPAAIGYGPWIEEVWINYLSNALKYGGRPPCVELGGERLPGETVRFWVRDNGPGLPVEDQARLFAPFTRLAQVRAEGYGLGLSIVERIVHKLGGEVGLESQVARGSTFWFTLPAAQEQR